MIAKLTVELPEGSVTRHYEDSVILNNLIDVQKEVESMVETIINSTTNFF